MDQQQRVLETLKWLSEVAKPVADKAEFSRWLNANNADTAQAEDWCTDCATAEVARLNAENPDGDYFVDGGWGCSGMPLVPAIKKAFKATTRGF